MDLNNPDRRFKSAATSSLHMYNFMPMPPPLRLPYYHRITREDAAIARRLEMLQSENLRLFWNQQLYQMQTTSEFKSHHLLPLARIKRVMKSNESVKMVSADTPFLFSKACEIFIMELTLRAWMVAEENQRRTIQFCDVVKSIKSDTTFDFLAEVIKPKTNNNNRVMRPEEIEPEPVVDHIQFPFVNAGDEDLVNGNQDVPNPYMMFTNPEFNYDFLPPK